MKSHCLLRKSVNLWRSQLGSRRCWRLQRRNCSWRMILERWRWPKLDNCWRSLKKRRFLRFFWGFSAGFGSFLWRWIVFFFNGIFKYDFLYETDGISPKKWREMGIFMMDVHWFFNKGSWMTSANRSTCSRNHQKKVFIQKRPGWWWLVTCENSATTIDEMGLSLQGRDISRAWLLHGWLMLADAFRFRY